MVFGGVRRRLAWERRQAGGGFCVIAAAAGFWATATAYHGDDFIGDVELDEDLDVDVVYSLMS